ncbi:FAD/NAD(P)-binding domain-containing protein [Hymenopellis radicata]|nr:FAD/NAD(P)-binding domain-containing protein [Hymenopellis radicata]
MSDDLRVVIVGAGIGGLCMGIALRKQLPNFENITIYEVASEIGGTWRSNMYPGCASDTEINLYTHSSELRYDWKGSHGTQREIQAYWSELVKKYDLGPHLVLDTRVVAAHWDSEREGYVVTTERTSNGERQKSFAKVVVTATGVLGEALHFPDIPGINSFKGTSFHSARWDHSLDLRNKTVGVIGSGPSAAQFIPSISSDPSVEVMQFCRSRNWYLPCGVEQFGRFRRFVYKHVPLGTRLARLCLWFKWECMFFWPICATRFLHPILNKRVENYLRRMTPERYHDQMIPKYTIGAKRLIHDIGYLSALHRPNVKLNWDGISSIHEKGILTRACDDIHLDVLIFATGYVVNDIFIDVRGPSGRTVKEYYDAQDGPYAYRGVAVPEFPNFFMVSGPNSVNSSTPLVFFNEVHANYLMNLIKPIISKDVSFFSPTHVATDAFNARMQARLATTVFGDESSWLKKDGNGRLTGATPYSASYTWWMMRKVNWSDWVWKDASGKDGRWAAHLREKGRFQVLLNLLVAVLSMFGVYAYW